MEEVSASAYRVPDNIAWLDGSELGAAEELYLTTLPGGRTVLLTDTARMIWVVATEGSDVVDEIAKLVRCSPLEIASDVCGFLADLTGQGLLEPR